MKEMNENQIIIGVEDFAKVSTNEFDSGHDWWHLNRVRNLALHLQQAENIGNRFTIEIAALLHDIDDKKFRKGGDVVAETLISDMLQELGVGEGITQEVIRINKYISFSSGVNPEIKSPELLIVQDADRLDAIGAIGVARAFNYGGFRNNAIYIPDSKGSEKDASTIGHFYDKLLKLKDMMNTPTAKKLAEKRHIILEQFLNKFYEEWNFASPDNH